MGLVEEDESKNKKKKMLDIALKVSSKYIESFSEDGEEDDEFEDIKYLTKKFNKFLNKEKEAKMASKKRKLICYECHEQGHVKLNCPYWKKQEKRRKRIILDYISNSRNDDNANKAIGGVCLTVINAKEKIANGVPFP